MAETSQIIAESKNAESLNAVAVAEQAKQQALEANMMAAFDAAFKKAFTLDDGVQRRFIDITRANLICQSIVGIDARLKKIEDNLSWGVKIIVGGVITAVLALLFK